MRRLPVGMTISKKAGRLVKEIKHGIMNEKEATKESQKKGQEAGKQSSVHKDKKAYSAAEAPDRERDQITLLFREAKAFGKYAQNFEGLYESFYQISRRKYKKERAILILKEYRGRIINLPELKQINNFFDFVDHLEQEEANIDEIIAFAEWWLSFLKLCGIVRDERAGALEIFNGAGRFYNEESGETLLVGDKCFINSPCWINGEIVVEKGRVSKEKES
jgi:hypothetical protein